MSKYSYSPDIKPEPCQPPTRYRALRPQTERQKSPRKAARERIAPGVERLKGEAIAALRATPSKVEQLEALVRAGRVEDPLAAVEQQVSAPHPNPLPASGERERTEQAGEGKESEQGEREQTEQVAAPEAAAAAQPSLLRRTQYLYEDTVLPVREIARLLGVSTRTLYKYVERYGWKRRHVCLAQVEAVRKANCGRRLAPRSGFAGVHGAGGRFISFEERGKPQPSGPKALDPLAAEAAGALCDRAAVSSNVAISEVIAAATIKDAEARAARIGESSARTLAEVARILRNVAKAALNERTPGEKSKPNRRRSAKQLRAEEMLEARLRSGRNLERQTAEAWAQVGRRRD